MKTYVGYRDSIGTAHVKVTDSEDTQISEPLRHYVRHSDGFEWGYGGSGPADLARSILIDFFGIHGEPDNIDEKFGVSYMDFKFQVIGILPREGFVLTEADVDQWVSAES